MLSGLVEVLGAAIPSSNRRKFARFLRGQKGLSALVKSTYTKDPERPTVWIHAASFGEFSVARPIITEMKDRGMQIVVTFFSPSGYEALAPHHPHIDYLYYLPFDTTRNVKLFLDTVRPDKAVFIVSEYWFNYLDQLKKRNIDTYLVSAKVSKKSIFFKWYGAIYRRCLDTYRHIFVIDEESRQNLKELGKNEVSVNGNPLFDNAIEKSKEEWHDPVIEAFAKGKDVFIAGSIHDDNDIELVTTLANRHHDTKFLFVPHEISEKAISALREKLQGKVSLHSEHAAANTTPDAETQVLIVDTMGSLAYIYRYAKWAYVGGGFTRYLHSLIEATVYGLPVSFGPETRRKVTPQQIVERGIGQIVRNSDELDKWFTSLKSSPERLAEISQTAKEYVSENAGSTDIIVSKILS